MKIKLFILLLFCAFPAFGEVFIMQTGELLPAPLNKTPAQTAPSLTADVDDEMLPGRPIKEVIRYVICGFEVTDISVKNVKPQGVLDYEEQNGVTLPDKYTTVDHGLRERCGVYHAGSGSAGKGLAVQAALKDLGEVYALQIRQADPIRSNRGDFNIKGKKPAAVKSFSEKGIYKKVLSSKNKIRKLYNYADLPLADEIQKLMDKREGAGLPIRISVYEDSSAQGAKGLAVVSFTLTEKYIVELKDVTEVSSDVYGIKPDYSYIYK